MDLIKHIAPIILLSTFVVSCQSLPEGENPNVVATYMYGDFTLPTSATKSGDTESFSPSYVDNRWITSAGDLLIPGIKIPVAIHLHGCSGFTVNDESHVYRDILLSQGYAVIMPNSFSRSGRKKLCGKGDMFGRIALRNEEVNFALKRIREMHWVDQDRIVLTGFSEGGNTADNWRTKDFAGIIVYGSACTESGGTPNAPEDVPVLAIVGEYDDYRPGLSCKITRKVGGSRSIVLPGEDHFIATNPQTREAVVKFLKSCCS